MKFLLLAAVDNRDDLLLSCLTTLKKFDDWTLIFVGQEFSKSRQTFVKENVQIQSHFIWHKNKLGMHNAKLEGLKKIQEISKKHVVVSIDDDMEFIPSTNFDALASIALTKNIGLVSGNWVRSKKMLSSKSLKDQIKKQHIVYTAGGLCFSEKISKLIIEIGEQNFWCDNTEWSLASFLNGYQNVRYLGSIAIHKILSRGGRKSYVNQKREMPSNKFIDLKRDKKNGYHIPSQNDLTDFAKFQHKINKK